MDVAGTFTGSVSAGLFMFGTSFFSIVSGGGSFVNFLFETLLSLCNCFVRILQACKFLLSVKCRLQSACEFIRSPFISTFSL